MPTNPFQQPIDPECLQRAMRGEHQAHEALFRCFAPAVKRLARRILADDGLAEEVVQDTFIEVMDRLGQYRGEAPVGFWIRRIAVNRALMTVRSYWFRMRQSLETAVLEPRSGDADPAEVLDIVRLLDGLPTTARAVVWLHDVEGYTHAEIGTLMQRTTSFSKSRLARAYEMLRERATEVNAQCIQPLKTF